MENWNSYLNEEKFKDEFYSLLKEQNITLTEEQTTMLNEVTWRQLVKKFGTPAALIAALAGAGSPAQASDDFASMFDQEMETSQQAQEADADVELSSKLAEVAAQAALKNVEGPSRQNQEIHVSGWTHPAAVQSKVDAKTFNAKFTDLFAQGLQKMGYKIVGKHNTQGGAATGATSGQGVFSVDLEKMPGADNFSITLQNPAQGVKSIDLGL